MCSFIYHISDIHILEKNFNNIKNSFNVLVEDIKKNDLLNSILVIAGDIFEHKTSLYTEEIFVFKELCGILHQNQIKTLIIPGNHDYNTNSKLVKDNVSLLVDYPNIHCFNQSSIIDGSIFDFPNLEFYIFSPIDKKIPELNNNKKTKIAILHETINSSRFDNDHIVENARLSINDLKDFDYVLLGDIHKPQFLTDTIAYPGSFVQKNKSEGIDHGYILWDLQHKKGTHIFIPLKDVYLTIEAKDNIIIDFPTLQEDQKVRYITFKYKNCTEDFINETKEKIKNKFGNINRIITDIDNYQEHKDLQEIVNIGKSINHQEIIKDILQQNNLENYTDKIITFHNQKLQNVQDINYISYCLNYMVWSNVFCYGENNYIDFKDFNNDLVVLNGNNKEGKSAVIDILLLILFNYQPRGNKQDIVNKSTKKGNIKLSFSIGNDEYIIEQILYKQKKDIIHRLYKNKENITKDTIKNTYQYMKKDLGLGDYKDFLHMTTALQNRNFLVDMTNYQTKDFLNMITKITNIDILKQIEDEIKSEKLDLTKINKKIEQDIEKIENIQEEELFSIQSKINENDQKKNNMIKKIKENSKILNEHYKSYNKEFKGININDIIQEIQIIQDQIVFIENYKNKNKKDLEELIQNIKTKCQIVKDKYKDIDFPNCMIIEDHNDNIDIITIETKIKELYNLCEEPNTELIQKYDQDYISNFIKQNDFISLENIQSLEKCEIDNIIQDIPKTKNDLKDDLDILKQKLINLKSSFLSKLSFDCENCKKCKKNNKILNKHWKKENDQEDDIILKMEIIQKQINDHEQNEIFNRNQETKKNNSMIIEHNQKLKDLQNLQKWNELQYYKRLLQIKEIKQYQENQNMIKDIQNYILLQEKLKIKDNLDHNDHISSLIQNIEYNLENDQKDLDILLEEQLNISRIYESKKFFYEQRKMKIKEHYDNLDKIQFFDVYLNCINFKNGIPNLILKNTCEKLTKDCNMILNKISDFTINIDFQNNLEIYTVENDILIPSEMGSGFQKFIMDMIIRISLLQISNISNPGILFIDEGFGSLDKDNFLGVCHILKDLKTGFKSLFVITHIQELKAYADKTINIQRKNNKSYIHYGDLSEEQKTILYTVQPREYLVIEKEKDIQNDHRDKDHKNILFEINDNQAFCKACRTSIQNKPSSIDRHMRAKTLLQKHQKYINLYI